MTIEAAVTQALAEYYRAFGTLDVGMFLPYFHEPFLFIGPAGVFAVSTRVELAAMFAPAIADLRARGYGRSELRLEQVKALGATTALASGIAMRYKTTGEELEQVGITYLLHRSDAGWKIAVMVLHGAG